MPSLLPRYLLRCFLPYFLATLGIMLFVMAMIFYVQLVQWAAEKGIAMSWTVSSFGDLLPYLLSLALPVSYLVALLLTLSQLTETGELTALRASGFSFAQILAPFLWAAAGLSAALLPLNHLFSPTGYHNFRDSFREGLREITRVDFEPKTLMDLGQFKFYTQDVDQGSRRFGRALLYRPGVAKGGLRVEAAGGGWNLLAGRGIELTFDNGVIELPNTDDPDRMAQARYRQYVVYVPFITKGQARTSGTREMSTPELRSRLAGPLALETRAEETTELSVRTATALAPLVFFFVAAPLGLRMTQRGRSMALGLSLVVLFGFYALLSFGMIEGNRSLALAPYTPWLADASGLLVAAALAGGLR